MVTWWEQRIAADEDAKQMETLRRWKFEKQLDENAKRPKTPVDERLREERRQRREEVLRLWRQDVAKAEIGRRLGITRERVRQIIRKAGEER